MKLKWGPFPAPTIRSARCPCLARPRLLDNQRWNPDSSIEIISCSFCSSHSANMSLEILTSSRFLSTGTFSMVFRVISRHRRALRSDDKSLLWQLQPQFIVNLLKCDFGVFLDNSRRCSTCRWEHQFSLLCNLSVPADNRPNRFALYPKSSCNLDIILVF